MLPFHPHSCWGKQQYFHHYHYSSTFKQKANSIIFTLIHETDDNYIYVLEKMQNFHSSVSLPYSANTAVFPSTMITFLWSQQRDFWNFIVRNTCRITNLHGLNYKMTFAAVHPRWGSFKIHSMPSSENQAAAFHRYATPGASCKVCTHMSSNSEWLITSARCTF